MKQVSQQIDGTMKSDFTKATEVCDNFANFPFVERTESFKKFFNYVKKKMESKQQSKYPLAAIGSAPGCGNEKCFLVCFAFNITCCHCVENNNVKKKR